MAATRLVRPSHARQRVKHQHRRRPQPNAREAPQASPSASGGGKGSATAEAAEEAAVAPGAQSMAHCGAARPRASRGDRRRGAGSAGEGRRGAERGARARGRRPPPRLTGPGRALTKAQPPPSGPVGTRRDALPSAEPARRLRPPSAIGGWRKES